jgi:glyoxylase-like metal-dependent hydrolase (beta-lactamase superfamily II)
VTPWRTLADGVLAYRHPPMGLTTGLVLGAERALVVDTGPDARWGAEWAAAVRTRTDLPVTVVLTHPHFDHVFGTAAFPGAEVWAHPGCARRLREHGDEVRAEGLAAHEVNSPARAALTASVLVVPDRETTGTGLDLGGRVVELRHPGPGHTECDLVVRVPDAGVVFAGDVVEHDRTTGSFSEDSFEPDCRLDSWPDAVGALLDPVPRVVVPGHGEPLTAAGVRTQRDQLRALIGLRAAERAGEITRDEAETRSPLPPFVTWAALDGG